MSRKLNRLYMLSIIDEEFLNDMKEDDPNDFMMPSVMWSHNQRVNWASMYYGWLVGKGKRKYRNKEENL